MKINLRWQALLAVIGFGFILALLSFQVQTASLCTTRVPASGGMFAEGVVGSPQTLNPLLSDAYPVDRELVSLIFDGLTRYNGLGELEPNLAESWTVDEDGLVITFHLRQDVLWHDGEPFTTDDVLFTFQLLQDDAFPGSPAHKKLWQAVTVNKLDSYTLAIELPEPYSPFLDATTRGILPAHLLGSISAVSLPAAPFNRSPVGTGPFMVNPGQDWSSDHRLRLAPNPTYWRQGAQVNGLEFRFYPTEEAMAQAFAAGNIQAINRVSQSLLPHLAAQPGVRLFTAAESRYTNLIFNLTESGSPALQNGDVRRALAFALDREKLVDEVLNGQGLPLEGPYLPSSWSYNPTLLAIYESQPLSATLLLEDSGWSLPENETVRVHEEESLNLRLLILADETQNALAAGIAEKWGEVGVGIEIMRADSVKTLLTALAARDFDVALVDIATSSDPDLYDFWSQEAIFQGQNYGGWNNRRASEALENGRKAWTVAERRPFYDAFLRQFNNDLPAISLYQHVYTYALSGDINDATIGLIASPRDRYQTFNEWFLLYRDVTVSCPDGAG